MKEKDYKSLYREKDKELSKYKERDNDGWQVIHAVYNELFLEEQTQKERLIKAKGFLSGYIKKYNPEWKWLK